MSGVVGMINLSSAANPIDNENILDFDRAVAAQGHRGPDGTGSCAFVFGGQWGPEWREEASSLAGDRKFDGIIGFNRFIAKTPTAETEQPFISRDGKYIVAFDGELYNREELSALLGGRGYELRTGADEELVLGLYMEYGISKALSLLNGMFAAAIVDLAERTCVLARDRLGIKPIYYSVCRGQLLFASELKCFTFFRQFERELDLDAFNARLIFSRPSDKVLFKNVEMVRPGEYVAAAFDGSVSAHSYFDINGYERSAAYTSTAEAMADLGDIIEEAVGRQLDFDAPFVTQVSGGIDSTLVNYYVKKIKGDSFRDGISIIDDAGHEGEEYWIDRVADAFGLNLRKHQLDDSFFMEHYMNLVWHNDAPLYKPYFTSFYKMAHSARDTAKIMLSGEGADETAGGYGRFAAGAFQPFFTKNNLTGTSMKPYPGYAQYAVCSDSTITGFTVLGHDNTQELLEEQYNIFSSFTGSNFEKQLKYETRCRLPESFMRQEKMASANSIEIRVPLVDNKVYDFIATLPESMLLAFVSGSPLGLSENPFEWIQGKYILKELCAEKMGRDFAYRNKQIIIFDERSIIKSDGFRSLFYEKILPSMRARGLVDSGAVEEWYGNVSRISQRDFNIMWRAIGLENWCQLFLDR